MSIFSTVISGVLVFVVGQFILKLTLEPIVDLKKVFGEISALFLSRQAKIRNANADQQTANEIKRLSASLLSQKQAIWGYNLFIHLLQLPKNDSIIDACGALNMLSYLVFRTDKRNQDENVYARITEQMETVDRCLKIKTKYRMD